MKKIIIIITLALATGCTNTQTRYITQELERPARPVLPKLSIEQGNAIEQNTWNILVTRHRMLRQYAEVLETIIDSTKQEQK